jgi:hypothetical protein
MTFKQPPLVAMWVLTHLSRPNHALAGDLIEEYQRGRSRAWYWRQVILAIVASFFRDVQSHKLATLQAVFTGFAAFEVLGRLAIGPAMRGLELLIQIRTPPPPGSWSSIYMYVGIGLWVAAAVCTGRLIARLYGTQRAAMILANVVFLLAWNTPEWVRLVGNMLENGRYAAYVCNSMAVFALISVGLALGGLWEGWPEEEVLGGANTRPVSPPSGYPSE